jgi:lipooligosaccharide transport system permease protein
MQTFARLFLPLTHTVNLTKGLLFGSLESSMLLSIVWIVIVTPVFFVLSINLMKKRLLK